MKGLNGFIANNTTDRLGQECLLKDGKHKNFMGGTICIVHPTIATGRNGLCGDCFIGEVRLFFALQCHSVDGRKL